MVRNAAGRLNEEEKTFIPEQEWPKLFRVARIWAAIHAATHSAGGRHGLDPAADAGRIARASTAPGISC